MSYYNSIYNQSFGRTFQRNAPGFVPPPPLPPPFFFPPAQEHITDEDIVKQYENRLPITYPTKSKKSSISISKVRDQIRNLATSLNEIKTKEKLLSEKINSLSDEEWNFNLKQIETNKAVLSNIFSNINNLNMEELKKLLAKRLAKRARQKRQRIERRKEKEEWMKQNKEKSRKIDEYLQKFQDDIDKAKQEEEMKLQADIVLKETRRKKQDAKKYIVKLDALVKLRKARQNTASGRGENVSQKEAEIFQNNIEQLKSMWTKRLAMYEQEEAELRSKLMQNSEDTNTNETEREVTDNLELWKEALFGGMLPQVDFSGDVGQFIAVRCEWDQYLHSDGSSIPMGWVLPTA